MSKKMKKKDLKNCVIRALRESNGKARVVQVCKYIWDNYKNELENSGDLFYTWQYDVRWAALTLRKDGIMKPAEEQRNNYWELVKEH